MRECGFFGTFRRISGSRGLFVYPGTKGYVLAEMLAFL